MQWQPLYLFDRNKECLRVVSTICYLKELVRRKNQFSEEPIYHSTMVRDLAHNLPVRVNVISFVV